MTALNCIVTLVRKDVTLYFKNRFFALITVLALVAYLAVYFLLPRTVDETLEIGWVAPELPDAFYAQVSDEGLVFLIQDSESALQSAILNGDVQVGMVLSPDFMERLLQNEKPLVKIFVSDALPKEVRDIYPLIIEEMVFGMLGETLEIESTEVVLGPDTVGEQIPPRDRMLPLLTAFVLMLESLGLASLIATEISWGTLQALLVTPLRMADLFISKTITGVGLAFSQAVLLITVTGGLARQPIIILLALLLGALLVTGMAFLIASVSKDLMSTIGWGMLVILVLVIPALNVLLPGLTSDWIRILPSYYLMETLNQSLNFSAGWADVCGYLLVMLVYSVAILVGGVLVLRRRYR